VISNGTLTSTTPTRRATSTSASEPVASGPADARRQTASSSQAGGPTRATSPSPISSASRGPSSRSTRC
jgi:hypothetical protein